MKLFIQSFLMTAICSSLLFALEPELKPLFDGTNLDAWETSKVPESWIVADGVLTVKNNAKQKGDILHTKKHFRNFVCELEFKFVSGRIDSGVHVRNDKDQIQIGESGSLKRDMTASPYIPGKGYPVEAAGVKELLKMTDWNTLKIRAIGPAYTTWLNGKEVMNYTSGSASEEGPLGIQLHGGREMEMQYRNIRVADLSDAK
ncbi:MAG: hypothetical protein ACI9QL_004834 [Candidatus Omnitrophota bacterium]|jgi:hypothetical protein